MPKKVSARTLDFSNVKESSGINPRHVEDGEYLAKVMEVRDEDSKAGESMWTWVFKLVDGPGGGTYPYYCVLTDNQLWKIRNLFIATGEQLPKKVVKIDPNKPVGKEVGLVLEGEEYEGKMKSVIRSIIPKEELADYAGSDVEDDEDDEEEVPVKKRRKAPVVEDDDDDEDEEEEPAPKKRGRPKKVVVEEEDDDEDEEPAPVKRGRGRPKKVVEPEDDDDDEEDEEPAPVKRGRGRPRKEAAAPVKKKRRAVEDDDNDLDIDL